MVLANAWFYALEGARTDGTLIHCIKPLKNRRNVDLGLLSFSRILRDRSSFYKNFISSFANVREKRHDEQDKRYDQKTGANRFRDECRKRSA